MKRKMVCALLMMVLLATPAFALSDAYKGNIYEVGKLKPVDSVLKVKVGEIAPGFTVPAAWTPVCSDQWPGYNIVQELFEENDAVLLGISVDNIPTLYSWTNQMGHLWFEVLSDFWPHGAVASRLGILRSNGTAERAIIIIDKKGIIRYIDVHDINERPPLESIILQLEKLRK